MGWSLYTTYSWRALKVEVCWSEFSWFSLWGDIINLLHMLFNNTLDVSLDFIIWSLLVCCWCIKLISSFLCLTDWWWSSATFSLWTRKKETHGRVQSCFRRSGRFFISLYLFNSFSIDVVVRISTKYLRMSSLYLRIF